jgi:hypothetical protein
MSDQALRGPPGRILDWEDAHASFDQAIAGLPARLRGVTPPGGAHSAWQLLEHIRIAQHDILDFCLNPDYVELPAWPTCGRPRPSRRRPGLVGERGRRPARPRGHEEARRRSQVNLFDAHPARHGQTYLREILLVADHGAYHVGQLVALRAPLGAWNG